MPRQQMPSPPATAPETPADLGPEFLPPGAYQPVPGPLPGPSTPDPAPQPGNGASSSSESPAPIPTFSLDPAKGKAYAKIAESFMHAVGGLLNRVVAVDEDDAAFLPDADDDKMIPPPLGRIAARRIPLGDGNDLGDVQDIGQALVGLIAWALKGLTDNLNARRERGPRGRRATGQVIHDDANPDARE